MAYFYKEFWKEDGSISPRDILSYYNHINEVGEYDCGFFYERKADDLDMELE